MNASQDAAASEAIGGLLRLSLGVLGKRLHFLTLHRSYALHDLAPGDLDLDFLVLLVKGPSWHGWPHVRARSRRQCRSWPMVSASWTAVEPGRRVIGTACDGICTSWRRER
jgi:hypothetical protein